MSCVLGESGSNNRAPLTPSRPDGRVVHTSFLASGASAWHREGETAGVGPEHFPWYAPRRAAPSPSRELTFWSRVARLAPLLNPRPLADRKVKAVGDWLGLAPAQIVSRAAAPDRLPWAGSQPASLRGEQRVDGRYRYQGDRERRHTRIHRNQGVGLQPGDGQVFGIAERVPVLFTRDSPRGASRHPIAEEPHLELREPFVSVQGSALAPLAVPPRPVEDVSGMPTDSKLPTRAVWSAKRGMSASDGTGPEKIGGSPMAEAGTTHLVAKFIAGRPQNARQRAGVG